MEVGQLLQGMHQVGDNNAIFFYLECQQLFFLCHVHKFLDKMPVVFYSLFTRCPWVTDPNRGSWWLCQIVLRVICKRPHSKIPHVSLTILRCLSTCHCRKITKTVQIPLPSIQMWYLAFSNVVFLWGMNVCQGNLGSYFISAMLQWTKQKQRR